MLEILTGAIMAAVAYAYFREGVLTALTTLVNVFVTGLVAFSFFEPVANSLEPTLGTSIFANYEDSIALFGLFILTLAGLRWVTNNLAPEDIELHALAQQISASAVALLTGYLVAGFVVCMLQTMPLGQKSLGLNAQVENPPIPIRSLLPPDRVWLALMQRAGTGPFKQEDAPTFDPEGTFEMRYERERRIKESDQPAPAGQ
jgi:hypothetical protein